MLTIRDATRADIPLMLKFIRGLAEYERMPDAVAATEADLERDGFGSNPRFRCLIAEWDGQPAGFALFFNNYSTWLGRAGIYLEDLFVFPKLRGQGIGKALLQRLAEIAVAEDLYGIRWLVLDWNKPAIQFYESLGAEMLGEWETMDLSGEALRRLAADAPVKNYVKP